MKTRRSVRAFVALLLAAAASLAQPAPGAATRAAAVLAPLATKFPGMAAAVAVDGKLVWSQGWGYADLEKKVPATPDTAFRIYSSVKPMTAAALARLAAEGRVDLDAPVQKYVPGFLAKLGAPVTPRLLASHLGGVRHYARGEAVTTQNCARVEEAVATFAKDPLIAPPGEKESYSSYGYVLLSGVVEAVTSRPFEDAMRVLVFAPAGMQDTQLDDPRRVVPNRAVFYEEKRDGSGFEPFPAVVTCKFGAGGFLSTAKDLARFGAALLAGKIVPAERVPALFTPVKTTGGAQTDFGFGWALVKTKTGRRIPAHSGGNVGGRSAIAIDPDSKIAVGIVANFEGPRLTSEALQILEVFAPAR